MHVRLATEVDVVQIVKLINTEIVANLLKIKARTINGSVEALGNLDSKEVKVEVNKIIQSQLQPTRDSLTEELESSRTLAFATKKEVHDLIRSGLSIVVEAEGKVVAHMCAEDLKDLGVNGVEITHGIVHPDYRDGSKDISQNERRNLQNRTRFALLNLIASKFNADAYVISVSKQNLVATPLEASGFAVLDGNKKTNALLGQLYPGVYPGEGWTVRCITAGAWKAHAGTISDVNEYNESIEAAVKKKDCLSKLKK